MAISKRLVLRSGFGIIIGLLVISTVMAFRIQESFSDRSVQIHRTFVAEQELLTSLRRLLWQSAIALRDHFINPVPDTKQFEATLQGYASEAETLLRQLDSTTTARKGVVSELRQQFDELWTAVRLASVSQLDAAGKYRLVQQEIAPRRDAAGQLLREIERANHVSLADSEKEFHETRAAATQRLLILLGICLFCGVCVALFSMRHSENLEQQAAERFAEVSAAKQELERLSARLMEVQEEERTRLSRELHDEIVQNLAVLRIDINHAQTLAVEKAPALFEPLARAKQLAESTVETVRNISLLLRPSLLDDLGLVPALQWQAEEFSRRTGIPCDFEDNLSDDAFPNAVNTCVYRVTQEALRNCEKHSRATQVSVTVAQVNDVLEARIEDNGVGLPKKANRAPSQLGLLGMRERAAALDGSLNVSDRPGGGVVVQLRIPVSAKEGPELTLHAQV